MTIAARDWKELSPLLDAALDLPEAEREAWLAALPPGQAHLREGLRELLAARRVVETDDFLERLPPFSAPPVRVTLAAGVIVGPYRLISEIGEGGTSSVWLAERVDGSIQRRVALKLPHLGLVDRGIEQRIARERDILAGLEHPNVARLYDAGVDDRGRPWLALEYVDGMTPDAWCREQGLGLRDKLRLFLDILRAVAFAHAHLVVHRDLKPTNILVGRDGGVRLLDFGIARLLQPEDAARLPHTQVGAVALTPAYAAPEQFTGQPVTVATDVYSLGVIFYELLSGATPYATAGRSLGAIEQQVLHVEPPPMSRAARPGEGAALRGDLDAIAARALEKAPAARYPSVEAFANDIERHLAAQPIVARPRAFAYVARKFLRRNAWPLALAAGVVVLLAGALGVAAWQWRDAERQRRVAIERLTDVEAASDFTATVLIEGIQPGEALTFEQLIGLSERIARETGQVDLRTRVFAAEFLANWYSANGLHVRAEAVLGDAIDSLPADAPAVGARLRCARADQWGALGRGVEAVEALEREIAANDADDAIASACLLARAHVAANTGDAPTALEFGEAALRRFEQSGAESVFTRTQILRVLAAAHGLQDDFREAHAGYAEVIRLFEASGRARGRAAAVAHDGWATLWMNAGNPRRALEEIDLAFAITRELSPNAQRSDNAVLRRARVLAQLGRFDEARAEFSEAERLAVARGNVVTLAGVLVGQADVAILQRELGRAEGLLARAAARVRQANLPQAHLVSTRLLTVRASLLAARGDARGASAALASAIDTYQAQRCCRAATALALATRAQLALASGDIDSATNDAARARELAPRLEDGSFSRFTGHAWYATGLVHQNARRGADARSAFTTAAAQFAGSLGESHPLTLAAEMGTVPISAK